MRKAGQAQCGCVGIRDRPANVVVAADVRAPRGRYRLGRTDASVRRMSPASPVASDYQICTIKLLWYARSQTLPACVPRPK
jgi:hypothetical protein